MFFAIGIDIVEIVRFKSKSKSFIEKIFTEKEIEYCNTKSLPSQHLAGRFSAKEAVIKALSKYMKNLTLKEIEIIIDKQGRPVAQINGLDTSINIEISISHTESMATAIAMVMKK